MTTFRIITVIEPNWRSGKAKAIRTYRVQWQDRCGNWTGGEDFAKRSDAKLFVDDCTRQPK
jgi:hypothetical protein